MVPPASRPITNGAAEQLSPLPVTHQPRRGRHAYAWTAVYIGAVGLGATIVNAMGWFSLPMDWLGAGAWFTVVTVMIIAPLTLTVMLGAWGILALYRKMGMREWPSFVQGLLASLTVLTIVYIIVRLMFAEYE